MAHARFDIIYGSAPRGYSVNIGDAIPDRYHSGSSEVAIFDNRLQLFGNSATHPQIAVDNQRLLKIVEDTARDGEIISLQGSTLGIEFCGRHQ